jgi:hypothetical protein
VFHGPADQQNCDWAAPINESEEAKYAADGMNAYVLGIVSASSQNRSEVLMAVRRSDL